MKTILLFSLVMSSFSAFSQAKVICAFDRDHYLNHTHEYSTKQAIKELNDMIKDFRSDYVSNLQVIQAEDKHGKVRTTACVLVKGLR